MWWTTWTTDDGCLLGGEATVSIEAMEEEDGGDGEEGEEEGMGGGWG